jgi:nucleoside-diphosphate-sugar epimerase
MAELNTPILLVTGAGGWLGLNLLAQLAASSRPPRVRSLFPPHENTDQAAKILPSMEIVRGDIRNVRDWEDFLRDSAGGVLIHTAGIIHPKSVRQFYEINLEGTKNLLKAATAARVKRAVIVSSNSPNGCNPHPDHRFDEQSPYHPYMHYGRSKMLMELAVQEAHRRANLETVLIRAPWFYGPFQPPRQTLFFTMIRDGKAPLVGSGANLRSMSNTERLAQGLFLAAASEKASGQIYWMADARPYSIVEIIDTIEKLLEEFGLNCSHGRMKLPSVASDVAFCMDKFLQAFGLYHQKIHVLSEMNKTIACTTAKAERELGFQPAPGLEDGMRKSIQMCLPVLTGR